MRRYAILALITLIGGGTTYWASVQIEQEQARTSRLDEEVAALREAVAYVAVDTLDVVHYVDSQELERNLYSDEEVYEHFIYNGLPAGAEYYFRDTTSHLKEVRKFWKQRLQEIKQRSSTAQPK